MDQLPPTATPGSEHAHGHGVAYALIAAFLGALAFGGWGVWRVLAPRAGDTGPQLRAQEVRIGALQQRVTTLARADQISRKANRDLQGTLADRDEEIAGLRSDLAFYERFVGSTARRRGLTVHQLSLQRQGARAWHFTATLTQNINRGTVNQGSLSLSLEGTRDGRMQKLDWPQLRQPPSPAPLDYAFKYFQQVEGDVFVPAGLQPMRVTVSLQPRGGAALKQSFTWLEATAKPGETAP